MRLRWIRFIALLLLLPARALAHDHVGSVSTDGSFLFGSFLFGGAAVGEWAIPGLRNVSVVTEASTHFGAQNEDSLPLVGLRVSRGSKGPITHGYWVQGMIGRQVTAEIGGTFAWTAGLGADLRVKKSGFGWRVQVDYIRRPHVDPDDPTRKRSYVRFIVGPAFRFNRH